MDSIRVCWIREVPSVVEFCFRALIYLLFSSFKDHLSYPKGLRIKEKWQIMLGGGEGIRRAIPFVLLGLVRDLARTCQ